MAYKKEVISHFLIQHDLKEKQDFKFSRSSYSVMMLELLKLLAFAVLVCSYTQGNDILCRTITKELFLLLLLFFNCCCCCCCF